MKLERVLQTLSALVAVPLLVACGSPALEHSQTNQKAATLGGSQNGGLNVDPTVPPPPEYDKGEIVVPPLSIADQPVSFSYFGRRYQISRNSSDQALAAVAQIVHEAQNSQVTQTRRISFQGREVSEQCEGMCPQGLMVEAYIFTEISLAPN